MNGTHVTKRVRTRVTSHFERCAVSASDLNDNLSDPFRIRDLEVREPDIEETIRRVDAEQPFVRR